MGSTWETSLPESSYPYHHLSTLIVVLCIILYSMVQTFKTVDKILKCENERYYTKQYFPVVMFYHVCPNFWVCG